MPAAPPPPAAIAEHEHEPEGTGVRRTQTRLGHLGVLPCIPGPDVKSDISHKGQEPSTSSQQVVDGRRP